MSVRAPRRSIASAGAAVLLAQLAGCALPGRAAPRVPDAPPPQAAAPDAGAVTPVESPAQCGADKLGSFLGTTPTTGVIAAIQQAIGHTRIRTIAPGDAVTRDFRPDRLDIELGADGRIERLRCY